MEDIVAGQRRVRPGKRKTFAREGSEGSDPENGKLLQEGIVPLPFKHCTRFEVFVKPGLVQFGPHFPAFFSTVFKFLPLTKKFFSFLFNVFILLSIEKAGRKRAYSLLQTRSPAFFHAVYLAPPLPLLCCFSRLSKLLVAPV
jgi:hypothetical protein